MKISDVKMTGSADVETYRSRDVVDVKRDVYYFASSSHETLTSETSLDIHSGFYFFEVDIYR